MKVIFLDLDGVLIPYYPNRGNPESLREEARRLTGEFGDDVYVEMAERCPHDLMSFLWEVDRDAVSLLLEAQRRTGASIVLSSGRREGMDTRYLRALHRMIGIELWDILPDGEKGRVISLFLKAHASEIDGYAVLDDADYSEHFGVHMVRPLGVFGRKDAEALIDALEGRWSCSGAGKTLCLWDRGHVAGYVTQEAGTVCGRKILFELYGGTSSEKKAAELLLGAAKQRAREQNDEKLDRIRLKADDCRLDYHPLQGGYLLNVPVWASFFPGGGVFGDGYSFMTKNEKALDREALRMREVLVLQQRKELKA